MKGIQAEGIIGRLSAAALPLPLSESPPLTTEAALLLLSSGFASTMESTIVRMCLKSSTFSIKALRSSYMRDSIPLSRFSKRLPMALVTQPF